MAWGTRARIAAIAALVLPGLVGVVAAPAPAFADTPVFLDIAPGTVLQGRLELRVQSTAPFVRISFAGWPYGYVVATEGGVATWGWETYGQPNGPTTVTADACPAGGDIGETCDEGHAELAVVLDNARPVITWPTAGTVLSGLITYRATAPEGGVAFHLTYCSTGPDFDAPYAVTRDTTQCREGSRMLTAIRCSWSSCSGPVSSPVLVTIKNLHPTIVARSRPAIDPVRAQARDTVRWTYRLGRAQYVRWRIVDRLNDVIRDWTAVGLKPKGDHVIAWAGHADGGAIVPGGTYILEIRTRAGDLRGAAQGGVEVRIGPPRLQVLASTPTRFYPVRDGFRDLFRPRARRGDALLTLVVVDRSGRLVRRIQGPSPIRMPRWDGRDAGGRLAPAGTYRWRLRAEDEIGHVTRSSWRSVALSHRRAEIMSWTSSVRAARATATDGPDCAVPPASSFGVAGLVLATACDASTETGTTAAGATYRFDVAVAGALAYRGGTVEVYARGTGDWLWGDLVAGDGTSITGGHEGASITKPGWYLLRSRARVVPATPVVVADLLVATGAVDLRTVRVTVRAFVWAD